MCWNFTSGVKIASWGPASSCFPLAASSCGVPPQAACYCSLLWQRLLYFCRAASPRVCVSAVLLTSSPTLLPGNRWRSGQVSLCGGTKGQFVLPEVGPSMMKSCYDSLEVTTPHLQMEHHNIKHPCVAAPVLKYES